MLVEHIMPSARKRLLVLDVRAAIREAAALMSAPEADLLVACEQGRAVGLITKTDIVRLVSSGALDIASDLASIMSHDMVTCGASDPLLQVWSLMNACRLQRVPVLAPDKRPVGVVYARDALLALLRDAEHEDEALRAYVQGVGYH